MVKPNPTGSIVRGLRIATALVVLSIAGCGDSTPVESVDALATVSQAATPAEGDFSTCEAVISIDDFDDTPTGMEFVDGRLRLFRGSESQHDLWVANTNARTMSRIDTTSGAVVSTYRTGRQPSRTAVDLNYDVFVANRAFNNVGSVMKFYSDCDCVGSPTTICQTTCGAWETQLGGTDDRPRGLAVDAENNVWVVTHGNAAPSGRTLYKLDNETGDIIDQYAISVRGYGLAIDGEGLIWIPSINDHRVICFDPETESECGSFQLPGCSNPYGIAVDGDGNIWTGNWTCHNLGFIDRPSFDAQRDAGIAPENITPIIRTYNNSLFSHTRGVTVDGNGDIWVASSHTDRIALFDPVAQQFVFTIDVCDAPIGVAISDEGHIWAMCNGADRAYAYRYDAHPEGGLSPWYQRVYNTLVGDAPYSYSDMTGFQLRNFTAPEGTWRQTIDCGAEGCGFDYIEWDANVPVDSEMLLRFRTSLDGETWTEWSEEVTASPAPVQPSDPTSRYIEVEITMRASPTGETPELDRVDFWRCPRMLTPREFDIDHRFVDTCTNAAGNPYTCYGIAWQFIDASWPETRFEIIDTRVDAAGNPLVRCTVDSTTSTRLGQRYAGDPPYPACFDTGYASNTYIERAVRAAWEYLPNTWEYSPPSEFIGYYTNVPDPSAASGDLGIVTTSATSIDVRWCAPPNNRDAALTGAMVVRSTTPSFSPTDPGYAVLGDFEVNRGYAGPGACGTYVDTNSGAGLEPETTYYYQLVWRNGDGVVSAPTTVSALTVPATCCYLDLCEGVCDGAATGAGGVCLEPPGYEAIETLCDGLDNDCDGLVDEGLVNACGVCGPGVLEVCGGGDEDCDGLIDNNPIDGITYYRDADGDTWGDPSVSVRACSPPPGYVTRAGDCDDAAASINPGAAEVCDGVDNNCDGRIDEGVGGVEFYRDADGDTWGDDDVATVACVAPPGFTNRPGDCDDAEAAINPDADEICDLLDNNCDGTVDEGYIDVQVDVVDVQNLGDVGTDVCDNVFTGEACGGTLAATISILNVGDATVPANASLAFFEDGAPRVAIGGAMSIGAPIAVGRSVTRTYCFGPTVSSGLIDVVARVSGEAAYACRAFEDTESGVNVLGGVEVCDGIDNDCDGRVDESPEACGAVLDCVYVERDDDYECVGTSVGTDSAAPARDDSTATAGGNDAATPRAGCSVGASAPASELWWMGLALGLVGFRRRRRG